MESASDLHEDVVSTYIGLVRKESAQAAAAIEKIHATIGARRLYMPH